MYISAALINLLLPPLGYPLIGRYRRFYLFLVIEFFYLLLFEITLLYGSNHNHIFPWPPLALFILWRLLLMADLYYLSQLPVSRYSLPPRSPLLSARPHRYYSYPLFALLLLGFSLYLLPLLVSGGRILWVRGASMEPTLQAGDLILTRRLKSNDRIERGQIVLFSSQLPGSDSSLIKRVIALPGDILELTPKEIIHNNQSYSTTAYRIKGQPVNNKPNYNAAELTTDSMDVDAYFKSPPLLLENFAADRSFFIIEEKRPGFQAALFNSALHLKEDEFFLLGDNRDSSRDSRQLGPIRRGQLNGLYLFTLFSVNWRDESCPEIMQAPRSELMDRYPEKWCPIDTWTRLKRAKIRWQKIMQNRTFRR